MEPDTSSSESPHEVFELMDLPLELVIKIFGHLLNVDLKFTCLTYKAVADVGAQRLLQPVYVAPRVAAMERFERICANLSLGRTIRELIYDARLSIPRLEPYSDYKRLYDAAYQVPSNAETQPLKEWSDDVHNEFRLLPRGTTGGDESYHAMIANGSLKYKELLGLHSVIFDYEEDYKIFGSAQKKLPNVIHIAMLSNFYRANLRSSRPA